MTRLVDILPPRQRRVVYAALAFAVPTVTTAVAVLADGWQASDLPLILTAAVSSAGFGMAAANTER